MCMCVPLPVFLHFPFLVNSTEGGKALSGVYPLQSSVSIIEEWYLLRGAGVRGQAGG